MERLTNYKDYTNFGSYQFCFIAFEKYHEPKLENISQKETLVPSPSAPCLPSLYGIREIGT